MIQGRVVELGGCSGIDGVINWADCGGQGQKVSALVSAEGACRKCRFLGPSPRDYASVDLAPCLGSCIFIKLLH